MLPETKALLHAHLEELKACSTPVIVEGKKDAAALKLFGISNIIELSKQSLAALIDNLAAEKECIILTDLDKEGKKLYGKLAAHCQHHGIKINKKFRKFLFAETKLR